MVNNFTTYEWMYYGGIAGGITFFALSVIIFVKYQIHRVIGELSGRTAKKNIRRTYTVKDGYNGKTAKVGLAFFEGSSLEVADCGCYRANGYKYASEQELLYYFDNHKNTHFPQAI